MFVVVINQGADFVTSNMGLQLQFHIENVVGLIGIYNIS